MQLPKMNFEKEKVLMPDGRYLIFYDFIPVSKDKVDPRAKPVQINESEGTKNV